MAVATVMNITNTMTTVTAVMTTTSMTTVTAAMTIRTTVNAVTNIIMIPAVAVVAVAADTTITNTKIKRSCPCCFWAQASLRRVFWQICF